MFEKWKVDNLKEEYRILRVDIQEASDELSSKLERVDDLNRLLDELEAIKRSLEFDIRTLEDRVERKEKSLSERIEHVEKREDGLAKQAVSLIEHKKSVQRDINSAYAELARTEEEERKKIDILGDRREELQEDVEQLELEEDRLHGSVLYLNRLEQELLESIEEHRDEVERIDRLTETQLEEKKNRLASLKLQIGAEINKQGKAHKKITEEKKELARTKRDLGIWYARVKAKHQELYPDKEFKV